MDSCDRTGEEAKNMFRLLAAIFVINFLATIACGQNCCQPLSPAMNSCFCDSVPTYCQTDACQQDLYAAGACQPDCCKLNPCKSEFCQHCWWKRVVSPKQPLKRTKDTFFQLWETEAGRIGGDDFQFTEVNTMVRLGIPLNKSRDSILGLQPGLRTFSLSGPEVVDVPEQLYDAQLSILWRKTYSERWSSNVWLQPKIRSDFETSEDNFFFSGGAFAKYTWIPNTLDVYFGALYLDRDDVSFLPGFGAVWTPTPDWRHEFLLPRPKFAKRISRCYDREEKWVYLSGQLGGGSFAVTRDTGEADKVTLRDLRLFFGLESVRPGGGGKFVEAGYVFNRGIEYKNNEEEYDFGDAFLVRGGVRF